MCPCIGWRTMPQTEPLGTQRRSRCGRRPQNVGCASVIFVQRPLHLLLAERLSCKPDLHSEIELVAVHSANSMVVAFMSGEDDQPTVR